jgi:maleate cis-trans isomerase
LVNETEENMRRMSIWDSSDSFTILEDEALRLVVYHCAQEARYLVS